ncbi:MAG: tRNA uridine-5-carboxymethylaminomethyl(34) synthesis GTPase MnmE [Sphingobacteriales bacterium JAD_PAG50586_3]|nr:MAG: tRNA uridine-5-carboxymethylaminomethyl(34) synthesis GTPase MnmE [Sphingobacteriales bacterium JAD_PAG50586_3]
MQTTHTDTIAAPATAQSIAAIALIRVSGPAAISSVFNIFKPLKKGLTTHTIESHKAYFGNINDSDKPIDEVLVTFFKGPNSFTGEDTAEISCHGSLFIQNEVLRLLMNHGARLAQPGEFTMRAFMNGRMDLSQAEAVADVIASTSAAQHRLAIQQLKGGFSKEIARLRQELIDFAALIELELDFGEEDVEFADRTRLTNLVTDIKQAVDSLAQSFAYGNAIKNGVPVVIAGKPNAGKSTLLNALLNEERAIVSDIAGTTRDTIEEVMVIDGISFRFVDTAGLRHTTDTIEMIGVERSYQKIKNAAILLYMFDAGSDATTLAEEQAIAQGFGIPYVLLANKSDVVAPEVLQHIEQHNNTIPISAKNNYGIKVLKERLIQLSGIAENTGSELVVTNLRHYEALKNASAALDKVNTGIANRTSGDFLAIDLRQALYHLGEITGAISPEDILGSIFSRFCIGK